MSNEVEGSNIIALHDRKAGVSQDEDDVYNGADSARYSDSSQYIVDTLEKLMELAAKKDRTLLVYLLAMARIEAIETSDREQG